MKFSSVLWIWSSFLVSLMVISKPTVSASTSTSTPSQRGLLGRSTAVNTTNVNPNTEDTVVKEEEKEKSKRGIFARFGRKDEKTPSLEKQSTSVGNEDSSYDGGMNQNGTISTQDEEPSVSGTNIATTGESTTQDPGKKKGRGPFGFFKPVDQVKKGGKETEKELPDSKENHSITEDNLSNTSSTTISDAKPSQEDDNASSKDVSQVANSTNLTESSALATPKPRFIVLGASGSNEILPPRSVPTRYGRGFPQPSPPIDHQALIVASVAAAVNAATRIWLIVWLAKRLSAEDELLAPEQHFRWECLNDRYSRDSMVLNHVLGKPPLGFSHLKWGRYLRSFRPKSSSITPSGPKLPTRSVVVVDITPHGSLDMTYLTDVVNFLVTSHSKSQFGADPEIVLLLESPGGGVSIYGLAAAQVGRLKQMGLNVTICIDMVAASGGYMIATQASKLVAAPFAQLGSIGVMAEGLNFNELLNNYGVKPMILKAGDQKNRLNTFGPVTDEDLQAETYKLEKIHEAFIEMCLTERPSLDPTICDGTVMVASQGLQYGIVDRVLSSEEYLWECIQNGAYVLKLHKSSMRPHPNYFLFRAMDLLPHLKRTLRGQDTGKLLASAIQMATFAGMILRSLR